MQYRLRTLVILTAVGPPALALAWFFWPELLAAIAAIFIILVVLAVHLGFMILATAVLISLVFLLASIFSLAANVLLRIGKHPDNQKQDS